MPEGPEVKTMVDSLKKIENKWIISIFWTTSIKKNIVPQMKLMESYLPLKINRVFCKGKQIFFQLYSSKTPSIKYYLNSGLGMEGRWVFNKEKHSEFSLILGDYYPQTNIVVSSSPPLQIYFDDSRHFGNLYFQDEQQFQEKYNDLGFDILNDDDTSWKRFNDIISKYILTLKRYPMRDQSIFSFLGSSKQREICGIGNYLCSEILYHCKINPHRIISSLNEDDWKHIYQSIDEIMKKSYQNKGLTLRTFRNPNGSNGNYQPMVYGRKTDDNNYVVKQEKSDKGRTIHWVPEIQL